TAALSMLRPSGNGIRTLIHEFEYPRLGPGMMWDACRVRIEASGGSVALNARIVELRHDGHSVDAIAVERDGKTEAVAVSHVISTMPVRHLIRRLSPAAPSEIRDAAERLRYRDFMTVAVIVDQPDVFPDNWIYVHDPSVRVGRIQNFKNWSPE